MNIGPEEIAAPRVSIERKGDGLLIHVSAKEGQMALGRFCFTYCHDFACTFVYDERRGLLWTRGTSTLCYEPAIAPPLKVSSLPAAIDQINSFLQRKAAGRPWY